MALLSKAGDKGGAFPWVRMIKLGLCSWETYTAQSCTGFVLVLCSQMGTPGLQADGARLAPGTESPLNTACTGTVLKEELLAGSFQVKG